MAKSLVTRDGQAELTLGDGRVLTASKALVAVGRTPNTAGLDCEKAGCALKRRGFVDEDEHLLAAEGVYAVGFFYPVVPKGQARIRTQISAAHTREQLDKAIEAFCKVGKNLGVIS